MHGTDERLGGEKRDTGADTEKDKPRHEFQRERERATAREREEEKKRSTGKRRTTLGYRCLARGPHGG